MRKEFLKYGAIASALGLMAGCGSGQNTLAPNAVDRTELPIKEPKYPHSKVLDARNTTPPKLFKIKAPDGAPNVLIVLVDDMGFGQSSAFGGPVNMPNAESLADEGLRFNSFHTTALSSPTRAALLSGRNHHMNNMGSITETATSFPGNTGQRPDSVAPLAMMLRYNGYSTAAFGKNHETAAWEVSPSGPTDRWPTRSGFDKFYGFMGGEANQWSPCIYEDMTKVDLPDDPNYHLLTDMTDHAIAWMKYQKSLTPDKPFFIYFAPGATHAPHHVPKEWIEKYKGKFDQGWDKLRQETFARQKELGVIPENTKLADKPQFIKDWDNLTDDEKRLFARQMEVFAGYGEFTDYEIGRLLKSIEDMGQMDDTLVFYILGDNGASAEGTANGLFSEMSYFNGVEEKVQDILKHIDDLGGPYSYNHYAAGWAVAGDVPFMWTKQVASNYGGTRNGLVVHWPKYIKGKGQLRQQWHHVIDVTPTILEAAGLPEPKVVNGVVQDPIEGVSMLYSFNDAQAKDRHLTQYFEMFGNRAVYHDGWFAGTIHRAPWEMKPRAALDKDAWELYDTRNDFSLSNDLAAKNPAKLKEMQELFMQEAEKYNVLPIDDRALERTNAELVGRPDIMAGRTSLTVYQGMTGMSESVFIDTKNRSYKIAADAEIPEDGAGGVILAQAGRFGGWSFYLKDGKPAFTYNFLGMQRFTIAATDPVPAGKATIVFEFTYDGGGIGKGGTGAIFVNDNKVAEGRIDYTQGMIFSADEGADVGEDGETPVVEDYGIPYPYKFTGTINKVTIDIGPVDAATNQAHQEGQKEAVKKMQQIRE
jgi:arylsulfatase A-like enzyme